MIKGFARISVDLWVDLDALERNADDMMFTLDPNDLVGDAEYMVRCAVDSLPALHALRTRSVKARRVPPKGEA